MVFKMYFKKDFINDVKYYKEVKRSTRSFSLDFARPTVTSLSKATSLERWVHETMGGEEV